MKISNLFLWHENAMLGKSDIVSDCRASCPDLESSPNSSISKASNFIQKLQHWNHRVPRVGLLPQWILHGTTIQASLGPVTRLPSDTTLTSQGGR